LIAGRLIGILVIANEAFYIAEARPCRNIVEIRELAGGVVNAVSQFLVVLGEVIRVE